LYAHEIFHSWNVKRLRPADMVPYRYDSPQPTPWLWVSEGITDYYADLAQVRGGVVQDTGFLRLTDEKIGQVSIAPPTALTDASLTTWVHPTDGTQYIYYPKGSLAGFMLDVIIRDASNNRLSLDNIMRELYETTYKKGRGFTAADWWGAVSRAAGGKSFTEFNRRYIDGRDPFPWDSILPLAGLRMAHDSVREPRLGIYTGGDTAGVRVVRVDPTGAAAEGGVRAGDLILAIGDIQVMDANFGPKFRQRYGGAAAPTPTTLPIRVRRGSIEQTIQVPLRYVTRQVSHLALDPAAPAKAARIRNGILHGMTDS
jgi:predicted metalloprotease with PDZ domain